MSTSSSDFPAEGTGASAAGGGIGGGIGGAAFDARSPHTIALGSIIDRLEAVELRIREAEAERTALLAEAFDLAATESDRIVSTPQGARAELAHRAVRAEVSACLRQSESATERQLSHAYALTRDYRAVFQAYRDGEISHGHTAVIVDAGAIIGAGAGGPDTSEAVVRRAEYERAVLGYAVRETPTRLRPVARRLAEQYAERSLDERHAEARSRRRVCVIEAEDGMADLYAHLPAVEAHAIRDRLTRIARRVDAGRAQSAPSARRTRDEVRADALVDLLLRGTTLAETGDDSENAPPIRARVQLVLSGQHLAVTGDEIPRAPVPAETGGGGLFTAAPPPPLLQGYGPIDSGSARRLAGEVEHWEAIHEDPRSGAILSVDRYRPSEAMRRLLGARDQHCRFPGCRQPLHRCDIDHTVDAMRGGPTATDNLAHLCRGHHTLKHHSGWRVGQLADGVLRWTSPTGRRYTELPDRPMRPGRSDLPPRSDPPDRPGRPDPSGLRDRSGRPDRSGSRDRSDWPDPSSLPHRSPGRVRFTEVGAGSGGSSPPSDSPF